MFNASRDRRETVLSTDRTRRATCEARLGVPARLALLAGCALGAIWTSASMAQSAPAEPAAPAAAAPAKASAPATVREAEGPRVRVQQGDEGGAPRRAPGGFGPESPVTEKEAARYADLLQLDNEQRLAAVALAQSVIAQHEEFRASQEGEINALRDRLRETGDPSELMTKMPEIARAAEARTKELESSFFDDLKLLLSPEQLDRMPRVDRQRRRDRTLENGVLSGERVDLIDVVDKLELTTEDRAAVEPILDEYETDLDRALVERNKVVDEQARLMNEGAGLAAGAFELNMDALRETGARVSEVNRAFTSRLADALSDDASERFTDKVKERTFPKVYRQGLTASVLDSAMNLDDLTPEQKAEMELVIARYREQVEPANDRWARALAQEEASGQSFSFGMGGQTTSISINDGPEGEEPESVKARRERRELDERTRESIRSILTDGQRERLPKPPERRPSQFTTPDGGVIALGGPDEDDFDSLEGPEMFDGQVGAVMMVRAVEGVALDEDGNPIEIMEPEGTSIEIFEMQDGKMVPITPPGEKSGKNKGEKPKDKGEGEPGKDKPSDKPKGDPA